ncbi:MAG: rhodanese-like domain-containing protein, partial [Chloroflexota bacterium]
MSKTLLFRKFHQKLLHAIAIMVTVFSAAVPLIQASPAVAAPAGMTRLNMKSYGAHNASYDARLLDIRPQYLVDNPAHGFWGEYTGAYSSPSLLQNVAGMKAAGIKVIGYTSSGYEGRGSAGGQPLSMFTLAMLQKQITNMALLDGVDGVFIDECDSFPDASQKYYLKGLSTLAHSLGIIIWGNTGVDNFDPWYFNEGGFDLMQSTERWQGQALSAVQQAYGSRISVTGFQSGYTAEDAYNLTLDAWNKGIALCYINNAEYQTIAPWFEQYATQLKSNSLNSAAMPAIPGVTSTPVPTPTPTPTPTPIPTPAPASVPQPSALQISTAEAYNLMQNNPDVVVLDVRTYGEYTGGHITGSLNLPNDSNFLTGLAKFPKDLVYLTYCASGGCPIAAGARDIMISQGYTPVALIIGGIVQWQADGYPMETGPGSTTPPPAPSPTQNLPDITVVETYALIQSNFNNPNFVLLDVRTPAEYAAGHIEGALIIDYYAADFTTEVNKLAKDKAYLIYCRTGNRSKFAQEIMSGLGFSNTANMLGGITQW